MPDLSIGKFAELNCVSERMLRHYQSKGLLEPSYVDDSNGYRYYSIEQCATIDMIAEFQGIGFSIDEIKTILENRSINALESSLNDHVASLEAEIATRIAAKKNAERLLESCRTIRESPLFNVVMLENIHERTIIDFEIFNDGAVELSPDGKAYLKEWEMNLRLTKQAMLQRGFPASLFRRIGCRIAKTDLTENTPRLAGSFVLPESESIPEGWHARILPAGRYLTLYTDHYVSQDNGNAELNGIRKLLGYAKRHHFQIVGDYLGEIIAETPAFYFEGRDMLFKQQVPVAAEE